MLIDELLKANIEAMKNKDKDARAVLSVVISKYKAQAIEMKAKGQEIQDADLLVIISKSIKELEDEQNEFKQVGNQERVEGLEKQKNIISVYLPKMLSEDEVKEIILSLEDKSIPNIMKHFKEKYLGKVDMGLVNKVARSL
ncbi:MAG: GatB/YqeY domain-containing protein [Bacilli bacterium]|nr:GatB/YqeY domain-containing protein [Bacilli bacterium]